MDSSDIRIYQFLKARNLMQDQAFPDHCAFLKTEYITRYLYSLSNFEHYNITRLIPEFHEEINVSSRAIWSKHNQFLQELSFVKEKRIPQRICDFLKATPFKEFLIIMGQRFTPGSSMTKVALPPATDQLKEAIYKPFNKEIKVGVRAWEKHIGRTNDNFWGEITGTPKEREEFALQKINAIFEDITWWNTFEHFKHGIVYEIREPQGHGLRWSINPVKFIGFVEPFTAEYE